MQKYLQDTQAMVRNGNYEEALKRHIWFFQHATQHDPHMSGVRVSFALSDWKALGDVYPPAKAAMIEMRDAQSKQFAVDHDVKTFEDVVALNGVLAEDEKSIDLFQWLDATKPGLAQTCWPYAKKAVLDNKRYALAGKYIGNPVTEYESVKERYDLMKSRPVGGAMMKAMMDNQFVFECLQLIDLSLALGEPEAAKQIQEKALAQVDDRRLRKAIPATEEAK